MLSKCILGTSLAIGSLQPICAQLLLNTASGWTAITNSSRSATAFTDANTSLGIGAAGSTSTTWAYNLVGGSDASAAAVYSSNPMVQLQVGDIGVAGTPGVAIRVRLEAFNLASINSGNGLMLLVGFGKATNPEKANFGLLAQLTSNGTSTAAGSIYILDSNSATGVTKPADMITTSGGGLANEITAFQTGLDALAASPTYISYGSTTNAFNGGTSNSITDTTDAWLTFGVTFAAVNAAVSSAARSGVNFDASSGQWNLTVATYNGTVATTGAPGSFNNSPVFKDTLGSSTSLLFSDAVLLTGATTAVPEPSTIIMVPVLIGAALGFRFWRSRRTAVPAGAAGSGRL